MCAYPVELKERLHSVSCGRCMPCRINKKREWVGRMLLEMRHTPTPSGFWTLTYDEEHLPPNAELDPTHLKRHFDYLRKLIGPFRYFAVGEYGELYGRPHYHVITFGVGLQYHQKIQQAWKHGNVCPGEATRASMSYVAGYVTKKLTKDNEETRAELNGRRPEFARYSTSPPLGIQGMLHIERMLYTREGAALLAEQGLPNSFRMDGRMWPLSKWCKNWLAERLVVLPEQAGVQSKPGCKIDYDRLAIMVKAENGNWDPARTKAALYQEKLRLDDVEQARKVARAKNARKRAEKAWRQKSKNRQSAKL